MGEYNINVNLNGGGGIGAWGGGGTVASGGTGAGSGGARSGMGRSLVSLQKQREREAIAVLKAERAAEIAQAREQAQSARIEMNLLKQADKQANEVAKEQKKAMVKTKGFFTGMGMLGGKIGSFLNRSLGEPIKPGMTPWQGAGAGGKAGAQIALLGGILAVLNEFMDVFKPFTRLLLLPVRILAYTLLKYLAPLMKLMGQFASFVASGLSGEQGVGGVIVAALAAIVVPTSAIALIGAAIGTLFGAIAAALGVGGTIAGGTATAAGLTGVVGDAVTAGGATLATGVVGFFAQVGAILLAAVAGFKIGEWMSTEISKWKNYLTEKGPMEAGGRTFNWETGTWSKNGPVAPGVDLTFADGSKQMAGATSPSFDFAAANAKAKAEGWFSPLSGGTSAGLLYSKAPASMLTGGKSSTNPMDYNGSGAYVGGFSKEAALAAKNASSNAVDPRAAAFTGSVMDAVAYNMSRSQAARDHAYAVLMNKYGSGFGSNQDVVALYMRDYLQSMPQLATGGFVKESGMAVIHKGETVVPAGKGMITINITGNSIRDDRDIDAIVQKVSRALQLQTRGRSSYGVQG